ncbi:O-antigen translocase [Snuella sedimenti]|uniref:O-antigen translocase n=1 Tax=Snuella sedimenti TaxID=2798802 RepID=A0A8J7IXU9_9FLAO|nr:O-antigen translocase [Snuella sedimenti]MBJ6369295.1 O-antigen translocase [Snuella sedimenti]
MVIGARLIISVFVQRVLALAIGEAGIAKVGQLRNLVEIVNSVASLGIFNGLVKYVAELKDNNEELKKVFSTAFVFGVVGSISISIVLILVSDSLAIKLFGLRGMMSDVIVVLAVLMPVLVLIRFFNGIINGLSEYKKYAKIDLITYVMSTLLLLLFLKFYSLKGVLLAIVLTPIIQLGVIGSIFGAGLRRIIKVSSIRFKIPYYKQLLGFALMSFVSTVLINYIEIDIRTSITNQISEKEAGYWTAMGFISKNYMVFSSGVFTLYVIPRFTKIYDGIRFKKEVVYIYKTLLPIFGLGMLLVYIFREVVITIVYPNFTGMEPLFKWQLLGDFIRLATLVVSHQFLAKKMTKSFIVTELISLGLFYFLSKNLVLVYGAEGVVMAHFYRYIVYFGIVIFAVRYYFKRQNIEDE